ncbi:hypothetical protein Tco_0311730 [Tanacetum coccineum]
MQKNSPTGLGRRSYTSRRQDQGPELNKLRTMIYDDEDALPHDLADSDVEDLINVDDDVVSADVARSHDGDRWRQRQTKANSGRKGADADYATRPEPFIKKSRKLKGWGGSHGIRWTDIYEGINMHLQKAYNTNKASFKAKHWKVDPQTGTYDVEAIRRAHPEEITADEQASDTQEYPSLIDTFWRTHTVDGVFPKDEDRRIYEEIKRLEATGEYTKDEINRLARGGKQRGHIPGVGRVLPAWATAGPSTPASESTFESGGASGSGGCGDDEESADAQEDEDEDGDGDS